MDWSSKRLWVGILAGVALTVLLGWFRLTCWSLPIGVAAAELAGGVSGLKRGVVTGALVGVVGLGALAVLQTEASMLYDFTHSPASGIIGALAGILLFAAIGAAYGAAAGMAIRAVKGHPLF